MARIRSLKPSFFKNEELAALTFAHRLCYEGLWCYADRDGRLEDRPMRLKAEIFPYDDINMEQLLSDLCTAGFIRRYRSGTVAVVWIPTFDKHQVPKKDERPSGLPAYTYEDRGSSDAGPQRDSGGPVAVPPVGSRTEDIRTEDIRTEGDLLAPSSPPYGAEDLRQLWNTVTNEPIPRCREITPKRQKHVAARLKERTPGEWQGIFERIQTSRFCRGENDRGWVATFDWVVGSPDPAVKVLEGKYDDRRQATRKPEAPFTASERDNARSVLKAWGRCRHSEACATQGDCLAKIIRSSRESAA